MQSSFPLAAKVAKIIGMVLILGVFLDYLVLFISPGPGFLDIDWRVGTYAQMIDRGIVPLIGIGFILIGDWIPNPIEAFENNIGKIILFILAILLGFIFLFLTPFTFLDIGRQRDTTLQRISQEALQAEAQIDPRLQAEVERQRTLINSWLRDDQQLNQAIAAGLFPREQVSLLEKFKQNPESIEEYLETESGKARSKFQTEIRTRKSNAENQTKNNALSGQIRNCLRSLLIAGGYAIVGAIGLREIIGLSRSTWYSLHRLLNTTHQAATRDDDMVVFNQGNDRMGVNLSSHSFN